MSVFTESELDYVLLLVIGQSGTARFAREGVSRSLQ